MGCTKTKTASWGTVTKEKVLEVRDHERNRELLNRKETSPSSVNGYIFIADDTRKLDR